MKTTPVLYDTFNARYLSFSEVAGGFISNDYYNELVYNGHSLLMGPRGCGKTTLLKMLYPAAVREYDKIHNEGLFDKIPFWGVYIPTDIQWKRQIEQTEKFIQSSADISAISRGTVTLNVCQSLCKTFSYLITSLINDGTAMEKEYELSKTLISAWGLEGHIPPTLNSIELALLKIVAELNASLKRFILKGDSFVLNKIFYYDFLELVTIACRAFEEKIDNRKSRWALCFDELEIAPEWLRKELLGNLRSRDQKIIFKLTTAPIISFYDDIDVHDISNNATENNDFRVIKIWTSNQKEFRKWFAFCDKLLQIKIRRKYGKAIKSVDLFGDSDMDKLIAIERNRKFANKANFMEGTSSYFAFKQLAEQDDTFREFLISKKINPVDPSPKDIPQKDQIFRKIKQLVIYRLVVKNSRMGLRSRKVIPLYFGLPLLFELSDGNPRILISIFDDLLNALHSKIDTTSTLSINEQSRILDNISHTYLNVLSSHPDANIQLQNRNYNLQDLLKRIGTHFFNSIALESFKMDPVGSFRVDPEVNQKVIKLLELALYLGAIVYLDNVDVLATDGIINKRFRLTYTLAPYFTLLARDNAAVPLSQILSHKGNSNQNSLFANL